MLFFATLSATKVRELLPLKNDSQEYIEMNREQK